MATIELAVVAGVGARHNLDSKETAFDEAAWHTDMRDAMKNIEAGLGKVNRATDTEYYRIKITSILTAKAMQGQKSIVRDSCVIEEHFSHLLHLIPNIDLKSLFLAVYHLNLLPEFSELVLAMSYDIQKIVMDEMARWISECTITNDNRSSDISGEIYPLDAFLIITTMYISAMLVESHQEQGVLYERMVNVFDKVSKKLSEGEILHPNYDLHQERHGNTIKRLKTVIMNRKDAITPSPLKQIDIMHLTDISHMLSKSLGSNEMAEILNKLHKVGPADLRPCTIPLPTAKAVDECDQTLKKCLDELEKKGTKQASSLTQQLCDVIVSFRQLRDMVTGSNTLPDEDGGRNSFTQLKVIKHHLHGCHEAILEVIGAISENPLEKKWGDFFAAFEKNPERLARTEILLEILKALPNCCKQTEINKNHVQVALSLQHAFWLGFELLPLQSKLKLAQIIMSDSELVAFISEYPSSEYSTNTLGVNSFETDRTKIIQAGIGSLVAAESANDLVLHKMCEISLRWPEGTIQKIVDQILKSHHQTRLFVDIIQKLGCLLKFKSSGEKHSFFFKCFHKNMFSCWENGENDLVEHGFNFLGKLLNDDESSSHAAAKSFLKEMFFQSIARCLNPHQTDSNPKPTLPILPELLGLKILSCVISTPYLFECIGLHEMLVLCVCLGASIDRSCHFWESNTNFDPETHELFIECLEYSVSKIAHKFHVLKESGDISNAPMLEWVSHAISAFKWTTRLRFLPLTKQSEGYRVSVPSCLSEVCETPEIFHCCEELSYGNGTGLVAWHQCFVVNPALCPLSSLDIENLPPDARVMFGNGWIITLTQVLPFCLPHEWHTLLEATKVLLSDYRLHVPYDTAFMKVLPIVDLNHCHVVLGVAKIMHRVTGLLAKGCCVYWTSSMMWLHVSKSYCVAISRVVGSSAEFDLAPADAKLFMLCQIFCIACDYMILLDGLPVEKVHKGCWDNVFVLLLDLVGTYEKVWMANVTQEGDDIEESHVEPHVDQSDGGCPEASSDSVESVMSDDSEFISRTKLILDVIEQLNSMLHMVSQLPVAEHRAALKSKLSKLLEILDK